MRNKHANTCQHLQPGTEKGGVWVGGGGNNIRSTETTDLDRVRLEFTFEFH